MRGQRLTTEGTEGTEVGAVASDARPRTWPALLVLFFLPGITAEILSGSTPVLVYLSNPVTLFFNVLLYGSGAILIREVARRRGLGWPSILLLGAAYGVFEEGLVVNTWANPWLSQICNVSHGVTSGICDYSRVGGIDLTWAVSLTIFHAVVSIAIPILLVELLFPRRAPYAWLGRKVPIVLVLAEGVVLAFGLVLNFASFRQHHQAGPPAGPYLFEMALMALLIVLALTRRPSTTAVSARAAPRLWTLRLFGLLALGVDILLLYVFKGAGTPYGFALAAYAALLALAVWRGRTWSHRTGWSDEHRLALASGALGFLLVAWAPILELSGDLGEPLVALAYLILLVVLARRVSRRSASVQLQPALVWDRI